MIDYPTLITLITTGCIVTLPAICSAFGQSLAGTTALISINEQPKASAVLTRAFIFGTFLNETASILALVVGGTLLFRNPLIYADHPSINPCLVGAIFLAIALPASISGLLAARPHAAAIAAIARQPLHAGRIISFMMFILPMIQISVIFGLVLSFWLNIQATKARTLVDACQLLAGGLAFGLGTVGPLIGMTRFTTTACATMGSHPASHNAVASLALLSQALIETPVLFALGVAIFITTRTNGAIVQFLSAALAMGLSTLGPGLAAGAIATSACHSLGHYPARTSTISAVSMISQTFVDTSALYGVIIAVSLLLFT